MQALGDHAIAGYGRAAQAEARDQTPNWRPPIPTGDRGAASSAGCRGAVRLRPDGSPPAQGEQGQAPQRRGRRPSRAGSTPPVFGSGWRLAGAGSFGIESGPITGPRVRTVVGGPFSGSMIAVFSSVPVASSSTFTTTERIALDRRRGSSQRPGDLVGRAVRAALVAGHEGHPGVEGVRDLDVGAGLGTAVEGVDVVAERLTREHLDVAGVLVGELHVARAGEVGPHDGVSSTRSSLVTGRPSQLPETVTTSSNVSPFLASAGTLIVMRDVLRLVDREVAEVEGHLAAVDRAVGSVSTISKPAGPVTTSVTFTSVTAHGPRFGTAMLYSKVPPGATSRAEACLLSSRSGLSARRS